MSGTIKASETKKLYAASGNQCAFPGCNTRLTIPDSDSEGFQLGEMAHIVGESRQGPRGDDNLSDELRNKAENLVLLCPTHHTQIDQQTKRFSVAVLREIKRRHEERVARLLNVSEDEKKVVNTQPANSSVMVVETLPKAVFFAPTKFRGKDAKEVFQRIRESLPYDPAEKGKLLFPAAFADGGLYTFFDLNQYYDKLRWLIDDNTIKLKPTRQMLKNDNGHRIVVQLLNSLFKSYCSRKGIFFDKEHSRFFFPPNPDGTEKSYSYLGRNRNTTKKLAYPPRRRSSGEFKGFWIHIAAGIRFIKAGESIFLLSIRPERHLTKDGQETMPSKKIGPRVTRMKALMRNNHYLDELHLWRAYLFDEKPHLILNCGSQSVIIKGELESFDVEWPGRVDDEVAYKNEQLEDDLFSLAELNNARADEDDFLEDALEEEVDDE